METDGLSESLGRRFESYRAHHFSKSLISIVHVLIVSSSGKSPIIPDQVYIELVYQEQLFSEPNGAYLGLISGLSMISRRLD